MREIHLPTRRATRRLGDRIAKVLSPGDVVLLDGELGSGKTFLTRAIARGLSVPGNVRITSPTFTLVHEYAIEGGVLLHADLYRLRGETMEKEVARLGLRERLVEGAILIAEWASEVAHLFGTETQLSVALSHAPSGRVAKLDGVLADRV